MIGMEPNGISYSLSLGLIKTLLLTGNFKPFGVLQWVLSKLLCIDSIIV